MITPIHPNPYPAAPYITYVTSIEGVDIWEDTRHKDKMPFALVWGSGKRERDWYHTTAIRKVDRLPRDHPAIIFTAHLIALTL